MAIYTYPGGGGSPSDPKWLMRWRGGVAGQYYGHGEGPVAASFGDMVMFDCSRLAPGGIRYNSILTVDLPVISAADYGKEIAVNCQFAQSNSFYGPGYPAEEYSNAAYGSTKGSGKLLVRPTVNDVIGWDTSATYYNNQSRQSVTLGQLNNSVAGKISQPSYIGVFTAGPKRSNDPAGMNARWSYRVSGGAVPRGVDSDGAAG